MQQRKQQCINVSTTVETERRKSCETTHTHNTRKAVSDKHCGAKSLREGPDGVTPCRSCGRWFDRTLQQGHHPNCLERSELPQPSNQASGQTLAVAALRWQLQPILLGLCRGKHWQLQPCVGSCSQFCWGKHWPLQADMTAHSVKEMNSPTHRTHRMHRTAACSTCPNADRRFT
jgi:hypothetical protein